MRARDGGSFDQWNWNAVDGLLFQANDFTDSSYDLPLPTSFDFMHTLFRNAATLLIPANANSLDLFVELPDAEERQIRFGNQLWQVIEN